MINKINISVQKKANGRFLIVRKAFPKLKIEASSPDEALTHLKGFLYEALGTSSIEEIDHVLGLLYLE